MEMAPDSVNIMALDFLTCSRFRHSNLLSGLPYIQTQTHRTQSSTATLGTTEVRSTAKPQTGNEALQFFCKIESIFRVKERVH